MSTTKGISRDSRRGYASERVSDQSPPNWPEFAAAANNATVGMSSGDQWWCYRR